jgi:hypothetical protein
MCFGFALSPNLKHFCYHINEIDIKLVKSEKSFPCAKDVYIVSFDAAFDISKECANIGVVIRQGILPILCIAAKIKCKNSKGEVLGIALGVKKVVEIEIYDFEVQMDCWDAYNFLKSYKILDFLKTLCFKFGHPFHQEARKINIKYY